jgi:hypothetical protein
MKKIKLTVRSVLTRYRKKIKAFFEFLTDYSKQPLPIAGRPRWLSGLLRIGPLLGYLIWSTAEGREIYHTNYYRWVDDLYTMLTGAFCWRVGPAVYDMIRRSNHS